MIYQKTQKGMRQSADIPSCWTGTSAAAAPTRISPVALPMPRCESSLPSQQRLEWKGEGYLLVPLSSGRGPVLVQLRPSNKALSVLSVLLRGSSQAVLHCAHRATTASSWGLCEQEGRSGCSLFSFLPRPRAAGAGEFPGRPATSVLRQPRIMSTRSWRRRFHTSDTCRCAPA
jgi:hypothetical protein